MMQDIRTRICPRLVLNNPLELYSLPKVELITESLAWDLNIKSNICGIWKNTYLFFSETLRISAVNVVYIQLTEFEGRMFSAGFIICDSAATEEFYRAASISLMTWKEMFLVTLV